MGALGLAEQREQRVASTALAPCEEETLLQSAGVVTPQKGEAEPDAPEPPRTPDTSAAAPLQNSDATEEEDQEDDWFDDFFDKAKAAKDDDAERQAEAEEA